MEMWEDTLRQHRTRHRRENPSFSSSLLDAIYRSIDDTNGQLGAEDGMVFYAETTGKKNTTFLQDEDEEDGMLNFRRTKWMEKKTNDKVAVRRNSMADFDRKARNVRERDFKLKNSSSSSSDSSCGAGAGFSSSESEYFYGPKPIKTSKSAPEFDENLSTPTQKPKIQMDSVKATYSKALQMYNELKKVKQPISPGRKLATFLNSLFNGRSLKKPKFLNSVDFEGDVCSSKSKSEQTSSCSSASSFSKSCLSKTPYSVGTLSNNGGTKRSVRFCPVSVIVEENQQEDNDPSLRNQKMPIDSTKKHHQKIFDNEDEDDYDDAGSDSSSDLFELENLNSIGIERYREELPVYETTYFNTNRAIANGLIL